MHNSGSGDQPVRRGGRRKGSGKRADASAPWSLRAVQALADGSRWSIVHYLAKHEATVGQVATELGLSVACTSKHISILKESDLVLSVRRGREVVCRTAQPGSRAGELLEAAGIAGSSRAAPSRSVSRLAAAAPELDDAPRSSRIVRYQSKDMDDFLL